MVQLPQQKESSMDAYYDLLCSIIKRAVDDAVEDTRERAWVHSKDAHELCEMANIQYPAFKDAVLKKIQEHDESKKW